MRVTEGFLTCMLQSDPELANVGFVLFDTFHERNLHADLALTLCLNLSELRGDLHLLIMSGTLDTEPISQLLEELRSSAGQVTSDLESFRMSTNAEVKKELAGHYPKHYRPDAFRLAQGCCTKKKRYDGTDSLGFPKRCVE